jgi:hypothetical protein
VEVIGAALELIAARQHSDVHPEDPHGGDEVELHNDMFNEALKNYISVFTSQPLPQATTTLHGSPRPIITSDD